MKIKNVSIIIIIITIIIVIIISYYIRLLYSSRAGRLPCAELFFNVLYFTEVYLISLVRVSGLLIISYGIEYNLQSAEKLLSGIDFETYYL